MTFGYAATAIGCAGLVLLAAFYTSLALTTCVRLATAAVFLGFVHGCFSMNQKIKCQRTAVARYGH
ncbi:MAG: hypothetical protein K0Q66_755 [Chitinophagaceae bacterium]|nr:hypothetical protein [Chitinophagaceae bacterium]